MRLFWAFCTLWLTWVTVVKTEKSRVVCYFGSWSVYRHGNGKIEISEIDPNLCTHMIYSFVGITEDGSVKVLDAWNDLADDYGKAGFQKFNALREKSTAGTKTLVAVGGWNEGSLKYSKVVGDSALRSKFVKSILDFTLKYEFDGFDIDWEYPGQRGGSAADVENYVLLIKELRQSFDEHNLLLTAAVAAAESSASLSYDIPKISEYLDFINIMAYDLNGAWNAVTGHNAPLYAAARETTEADKKLNVNAIVQYWLSQGAPANKLVLGTGLYGRTFTLADAAQNVPGSPAIGAGLGGPYTNEAGMMGYNEICEAQSSWTTVWDEEQRVPYAYKGNQWVSYDDVRSITEKANFVKSLGLGGAMVWSIETDDFKGICGEKYPLLKALNSVLRSGSSSTSASTSAPSTSTGSTGSTASASSAASTEATGSTASASSAASTSATGSTTTVVVPPTPEIMNDEDEDSNIICDGSDIFIRDSQDCSKFWMCQKISDDDWRPVAFTCGNGLYFDTTINVCNYKNQVNC